MKLVEQNPFRIIGLLVGASAKEQERQTRRLKQFIEAEQEPQEDFSFPVLGQLNRTIENVNDASSKLNLGKDKITAALFWFFDGSHTDEPAFDAIKAKDTHEAIRVWGLKTSERDVAEYNLSAFSNISTLMLHAAFKNGLINEIVLEKGIRYKLKFIESDLVKSFIKLATDETFKISKKELQLLFLNQVQSEVEKSSGLSDSKFIEIINKQEFTAKDEFLKEFVQKPIEQIEMKIEEAKTKRKANSATAVIIGETLQKHTAENLRQINSILGESNLKSSTISDKIANEILQCSIEYFNYHQEKESDIDYFGPAWKSAKSAESIAVGKLTKERILDSLNTLGEMKNKEVSQAIHLLKSVKVAFQENERKIKKEVKELEETDIEILLGHKYINKKAVEDNIKNSIDWQKVNELLVIELSEKKLNKIKQSDNVQYKNEFLDLANWLKENSLKNSTITTIINTYRNIPPKLPFKIISSTVTNTDNKPLYKKYIRYLGLNLKVQVIEDKSTTFFIKYINPKGKIDRSEKSSPIGYTLSDTKKLNFQTNSIDLTGWGNKDKCTYDIGKHRIEIYVDEYLIHTKEFTVDLAPSEKLEIELKNAEKKLIEIKNTNFFISDLETLNFQMQKIQEWQFLRSQSEKEQQIKEQQQKINIVRNRANTEKANQISKYELLIKEIKSKLQKAEY